MADIFNWRADRPSAGAAAAAAPPAQFAFQHKVFSVPGSYFALAEDTLEPTFYVPLGDLQGVLGLKQLMAAFDINPGSADAALLGLVEKGLGFVRRIAPADPVPRELLDGSASWAVEDRHRAVAESRVKVQLAAWLGGGKTEAPDLGDLLKLAVDPEVRARVQEAVGRMAERLGLGEGRRQEVLERIDRLAHELSYIEALRDRLASIRMIAMKLGQLQSLYGPDRGVAEEIARVLVLMRKPVGEYDAMFARADKQTADLVAVLRDFGDHVKGIRARRDEIHRAFLMWDELIARWQDLSVEAGPAAERLLHDTYRLMARRFPLSSDWQLQFSGPAAPRR